MRVPQDHIIFNWVKDVLLKNNDLVIFDVGTNLGDYVSLCLSHLSFYQIRSIYGFEPNNENYNTVTEKFKDAGIVKIHNIAISSIEQETDLYIPGQYKEENGKKIWKQTAHALASLINRPIFHTWDDCDLGSQKIKTTTIDNFVSKNNIDKIDYLKIDVEGLELEVLKGAVNSLKSGLIKGGQLEYGTTFQDIGIKLRDVVQFLNDHGYNLYDNPNFNNSGIPPNVEDDWIWSNLVFIKR